MKIMLAAWDGRYRHSTAWVNAYDKSFLHSGLYFFSAPPRLRGELLLFPIMERRRRQVLASLPDDHEKYQEMFPRKAKPEPVQATSGRLEIERDGHVAYLEYTLAGQGPATHP